MLGNQLDCVRVPAARENGRFSKPLTSFTIGGIFATMRVILDTNVLVAASRSRRGASYRVLQLIPDTRFQICLSHPLYLEYLDVLLRPDHQLAALSEQQTRGTIRYLLSQAHLQEIYFHWRPFLPDTKDDMVLELAVAAQAATIVTFNLKHFRGIEIFGIQAMQPRDFLVEIGEIK